MSREAINIIKSMPCREADSYTTWLEGLVRMHIVECNGSAPTFHSQAEMIEEIRGQMDGHWKGLADDDQKRLQTLSKELQDISNQIWWEG